MKNKYYLTNVCLQKPNSCSRKTYYVATYSNGLFEHKEYIEILNDELINIPTIYEN